MYAHTLMALYFVLDYAFIVTKLLLICQFTGEHPCRSAISIKLLCNFIEIALRDGHTPVNLLHIFRTPFQQNPSEWLLLSVYRTLTSNQWRLIIAFVMFVVSTYVFLNSFQPTGLFLYPLWSIKELEIF